MSRWLGDGTKPPIIPPYIAQRALETIAAMGEGSSGEETEE